MWLSCRIGVALGALLHSAFCIQPSPQCPPISAFCFPNFCFSPQILSIPFPRADLRLTIQRPGKLGGASVAAVPKTAQVALEAGNSPQMIFGPYRELVRPM